MIADHDQFLPVAYFALDHTKGETVIHQLWITPLGKQEWRPLPVMEMKKERTPSVAGYLESDDEDR